MTPTMRAVKEYEIAYYKYHGNLPLIRINGSWVEIRNRRHSVLSRYQKSGIERLTKNLLARVSEDTP